jgi:protein required for attachment to host cells
MPNPIKLPDAMPDVDKPTLLVVCDSHHCRLFDVGGHTLLEKETIRSSEPRYTDRQDSVMSGGKSIGVGENDQVEDHRLHEFANAVVDHLTKTVTQQKIGELHISAPGKFLSQLKKHLTKPQQAILKNAIDGNFVKESPLAILVRFRPDLEEAVKALRDQENYSPKKQPPKK